MKQLIIVVAVVLAFIYPHNMAYAQTLNLGMNSKNVTYIQKLLVKHNFLSEGSNKVDGKFGYKTLAAIKVFQKKVGLEADGIVGVKTYEALRTYDPKKRYEPSKVPTKKPSGIPSYQRAINVKATAYTRYDEGCGDLTYLETYARRGVVAVDPAVIPLRSKLYIPGYGHASAEDIGGAIQGNRIDLFMETLDEAFEYGVQNITVYVL